jgi:DNA-binding GntR family transcriptional regulator
MTFAGFSRPTHLELMAARKDPYGLAQADVAFHRELCDISGNDFIRTIWEGAARQLTIVVGLSTLDKSMRDIVKEHRTLLEAVTTGDIKKTEKTLGEHIRDQNACLDLKKIVEDCGFNRSMQHNRSCVSSGSVDMKRRPRIYYSETQKA